MLDSQDHCSAFVTHSEPGPVKRKWVMLEINPPGIGGCGYVNWCMLNEQDSQAGHR